MTEPIYVEVVQHVLEVSAELQARSNCNNDTAVLAAAILVAARRITTSIDAIPAPS